MSNKRTFWLYHGGRVLGATQADHDATDEEVRLLAIHREENFPWGMMRSGERLLTTSGKSWRERWSRHSTTKVIELPSDIRI
jgi:hypothetical protein